MPFDHISQLSILEAIYVILKMHAIVAIATDNWKSKFVRPPTEVETCLAQWVLDGVCRTARAGWGSSRSEKA